MKKELDKIAQYCIKNNVEINFEGDGISVWTKGDGPALKICGIAAENFVPAVDALNELRGHGWTTS